MKKNGDFESGLDTRLNLSTICFSETRLIAKPQLDDFSTFLSTYANFFLRTPTILIIVCARAHRKGFVVNMSYKSFLISGSW